MALTTYNQVSVPSFMYGTAWKKEATTRLVELAVESGFAAIDTANQLIHYQEALVGEALQSLALKGVRRDALFLQTKFTSADGQDHRTPYDRDADLTTQVNQSFTSSLQHLHTEYLDSYVLHAQFSRRGLGAADWEVWGAMEALYQAGKTKMIGVSNIAAAQLTALCQQAHVKPMMVQNRCFAVMAWDRQVREVCRDHGIILGMLDLGVPYTSTNITLNKDDKLFLYTDGIPEAMNLVEEEYSETRMIDFFKDNSEETVNQFIRPIVDDVKSFTKEAEQSDDITSMILKRV